MDRDIAASLPGVAMRLRLQDVSRFLADGLIGPLSALPRWPLQLLNIGGGPAIDSLNALIVLRKAHPELLRDRRILIYVLDLDTEGPAFGARALTALRAEGAPLNGLEIELQRWPYDWSAVGELDRILTGLETRDAVVAVSSEGALFEYGTDEEIVATLEALGRGTPLHAFVVGSVTRNDAITLRIHAPGGAAVRPRGLDAFRRLLQHDGWTVERVAEGVMSDQVRLTKSPVTQP
jgi:hypothetical protein